MTKFFAVVVKIDSEGGEDTAWTFHNKNEMDVFIEKNIKNFKYGYETRIKK